MSITEEADRLEFESTAALRHPGSLILPMQVRVTFGLLAKLVVRMAYDIEELKAEKCAFDGAGGVAGLGAPPPPPK